ncbi:MAG: ATP synthase F1 subunit epsilon [Oscillospiraceae bacterium]|nr:ATP synthase F1 subunit epsilon [Oscillospiraceae bacterium]
MREFQIHILTAGRIFYEGPCESLVIPTLRGQYGIWAGHRDLISAVVPGSLLYRIPGQEMQEASVSEGLFKIEDGEVLVLVDSAERPEEIDENRARRAADQAREAMLQRRSIVEYRSAQANLARAASRLRVKGHSGQK